MINVLTKPPRIAAATARDFSAPVAMPTVVGTLRMCLTPIVIERS